jgi:hypothetical protein
MQIILGALGSIVTVLWLLHRLAEMGIDLGGLNPWLWRRKKHWQKKFTADPIYGLDQPLGIAGVLVLGVAKIDGDLSIEEKRAILNEFEMTFELSEGQAEELLSSSAYLLGNGEALRDQLDELLARYQPNLNDAQVDSLLTMVRRIAATDARDSAAKQAYLDTLSEGLTAHRGQRRTWG